MFCPKTGCHISQCQSGSVTAFEVWNVSPSPCLFFWGGGEAVFTSAALHFGEGLAEHQLIKQPPLGPSQTLILSISEGLSSGEFTKRRKEKSSRVSRWAIVCDVKTVCWRWRGAGKKGMLESITVTESQLWAFSASSWNKTALAVAAITNEPQRNSCSHQDPTLWNPGISYWTPLRLPQQCLVNGMAEGQPTWDWKD